MVHVETSTALQVPGTAVGRHPPAYQDYQYDQKHQENLRKVRMAELQAEQEISLRLNEAHDYIGREVHEARLMESRGFAESEMGWIQQLELESAQNRQRMLIVTNAEHQLQSAVIGAQSQLEAIELRAYTIGQERALAEADQAQRENVERLEHAAQAEHRALIASVELGAQETIAHAKVVFQTEASNALDEQLRNMRSYESHQYEHAQSLQYELSEALRQLHERDIAQQSLGSDARDFFEQQTRAHEHELQEARYAQEELHAAYDREVARMRAQQRRDVEAYNSILADNARNLAHLEAQANETVSALEQKIQALSVAAPPARPDVPKLNLAFGPSDREERKGEKIKIKYLKEKATAEPGTGTSSASGYPPLETSGGVQLQRHLR
jgi:vacuolar-type H+-ATPase subunit E/Vma4